MLIKIEWSETNDGWMYDIYDSESDIEDGESIDGGLCTGTRMDAFEMAVQTAELLVPQLLEDWKGDEPEEE